ILYENTVSFLRICAVIGSNISKTIPMVTTLPLGEYALITRTQSGQNVDFDFDLYEEND
ncbi:12079_t:CDS:1, partial [Racocetra persica]